MSQTSPPLKLSGPQIYQLTELLCSAFSNADLVLLLSRIGQDFEETVVSVRDRKKNIFYMLSAASDNGWCGQLLAVVLDERPDDQEIQQFSITLGLVRLQGPDAGNLEAIARSRNSFVPVVREAILQLERSRWICKIEHPTITDIGATGFLVAPDLVLTNCHVIDWIPKPDLLAVGCRFDFRMLEDGITIDPGRIVSLDPNWQPLTRPFSRSDVDANVKTEPRADELDYALLRLARPIGNEPIGDLSTALPGRRRRGWLKLYSQPPALQSTDQVIVLQHPQPQRGQQQSPLEKTFGPVVNCSCKWRVRYTADTLPGSSGSPCFNQQYEFVALHHVGDPLWKPNGAVKARFNQGIPAAAIVADFISRTKELQAQNVQPFWTMGPPPPPGSTAAPVTAPAPSEPPVVKELRRPAVDALVASLSPLLPVINRTKLRSNIGNIAARGNGYQLTRVSGGPGAGKSYSYELIKKAAGENGITSGYVDLQGKSLSEVCELIVRSMKLDDEDMLGYVLRDKPDDGPLARKFVRWLSKATASFPERRWWLMLDSLDKPSVLPEVREILVGKLLESLALDELPSVHLILVGHTGPLADKLALRAQLEVLTGINRADVETFLSDWANRRGKQLRPDELRALTQRVVGPRTGPFSAADLDAIRESTALVLEEVLT